MPIRVYDLSKKLGIENKVIIDKAQELGIAAAKVPSSSLDKVSAEYLEEELLKMLGIRFGRGLTSIGLGNFKAFGETQSIPIKPITLIFGANSSGKSSLIHGALLALEAVNTGNLDIYKTEIGGDSVDLGGFRQYMHRHRVAKQVEWSAELETRNLQGNAYAALNHSSIVKVSLFFGIPLDDKGNPQRNYAPRLVLYDIEAGGKLIIRLGKRDDGSMQILKFDINAFNPIAWAILNASTTTAHISGIDDRPTVNKAISEVLPQLRFECLNLLPEKLIGQDYSIGPLRQMFAIRKGDRQQQLSEATKLFIPRAVLEVIKGVNAELCAHLGKIVYLGPLRSFPPRHLAFTEDNDKNWYAGGGFAWDLVRKNADLRTSINLWLSSKDRLKTPYRLEVERYFTAGEVKSALEQGFESIGSDIVARILGDVQNVKEKSENLLESREELETERSELELELTRLAVEYKDLDAGIANAMKAMGNLASRHSQLLIKREQILNELKEGDQGQELILNKNQQESAGLETGIIEIKNVIESFESYKVNTLKREGKIRDRLDEIRRRKEEIFSGLRENLDVPEIVKRLYDGIENRPERDPVDELILMDCRTDTRVTHRDVGIGVSQVLPVLVHAYADNGKIVAIEQPEIHLHPQLQAELGDVFIESALGDRQNTFLLETHSEHLILRILRRIRETTEKRLPVGMQSITPDDVTVVYVDPTANGSVIKHMKITPDGDFAEPWPGGFFTDRLNDLP